MVTSIQFSSKSIDLLQKRKLDSNEISNFSAILEKVSVNHGSSKDFLKSLSYEELKLVQKANSLAENIDVDSLSTEGAQNLLAHPDGSDRVDLNNDGIVEVGLAKTIQFPPVNAPKHVKEAWEKATEGMAEMDAMLLQFSMHTVMYGIDIEGFPQKTPLSPAEQWSDKGVNEFFNQLYGNLEFKVNREGWTEHNIMLKDFYQRFEYELSTSSRSVVGQSGSQPSEHSTNSMQASINQLILDARIGLDREKLDEIDQKMKEIENNPNLSPEEKQALLQALQAEKEELIKQASERVKEQEKLMANVSNSQLLMDSINSMTTKQPRHRQF
ncbi:hypothetical protein tinsulaeT_03280 [Thalassotalea insulae]|uniref:Uncharacterized protein n=1 Tax=Thalassotalea insulae TaxID=2056778 RepID=A0ABQ6GLX0_9GAMM|nr:DUF1542 domain-containing protein [Thalassotalea insulae]GLX76988.1 hypothetical protein tinsulaeT_03280 [Thalassotalea insulae]